MQMTNKTQRYLTRKPTAAQPSPNGTSAVTNARDQDLEPLTFPISPKATVLVALEPSSNSILNSALGLMNGFYFIV